MIYFDNAATSNFKPLKTRFALFRYTSKKYNANPGRSAHKLANNLANKILIARENINSFFNNDCIDHVIFTSGCTESLNTSIMGTIKKKGHVIITSFEHNSVIRPIHKMFLDNKISYTIVSPNLDGKIDIEELKKQVKNNTYLIIATHTSNVTGASTNIFEIGQFCKKNKLMFLVDGAQGAGHTEIDMQKNNIDILCLAGHKGLLGPQGVGVILYKKNIKINPLKFGGTGVMSESLNPPIYPPESLEAGTLPTTNILALNESVKYLKKNMSKNNARMIKLSNYFYDKISKIKDVNLYTPLSAKNGGIITFNINNVDTNEFANYLSKNNVCIRSGLHCAPLIHKQIQTIQTGAIRASISFANNKLQIDKFIKLIKNYKKV